MMTTSHSETEATARWMAHINALASGIGYRLPGSPGEAQALEYCRKTLAGLGLSPETDSFGSGGSVFRPHLGAAVLFLLAFALYPLALPVTGWVALGVTLFALVSETLEVTLRPHPLQLLPPRRRSGNVFAVVEPRGAAGSGVRDLVLVGHVDTQRTPVIFSTPGWFRAYRWYSTGAFVAFVLQAALYAGGLIWGFPWVWPVSGISAVMAALLVALCVEADLSPSTHGANDNASAAGLVLTLAEDLVASPLERTRVWLVLTGCEEALHEGAKAFFARHAGGMAEPRAVVFEMLGSAGPAWLESEGFVIPLKSSPELRRLAESAARRHPELGARPGKVGGGVTEMSDAILAGIPAITIMGLTPQGGAPYWHLPTDTVDKMDVSPGGAMDRNYRFVKVLLEEIDRPA